MKDFINSSLANVWKKLYYFIHWSALGSFIGIIIGLVASLFSYLLTLATNFRTANSWVFLTLPIGGVLIVFLYRFLQYEHNKGTDSVIESVEDQNDISVSPKMAFLIFVSTVITIFCGGSVGREGAALQIGGGLGKAISNFLNMEDKEKKVMLMSGMAAAFSALFGTPMTAAFFAMEVSSIGIMHYAALVPCICAALVARYLSSALGVHGEAFHIIHDISLTPVSMIQTVFLAAVCALVSIQFCLTLQYSHKKMHQWLKNPYLRIITGGLLLIVLTLLLGTQDYLGTGMHVIEQAVEGHAVPWAFMLKIVFTSITIAAGFKGGEIVPSLFIGATLGCCLGGLIGLPASLGAGIGMVSVFCGVTNCPVASLLIAFELFGFTDPHFYLIAVAVSYMFSGHIGLYHTQKITYSKYTNIVIDRETSQPFH